MVIEICNEIEKIFVMKCTRWVLVKVVLFHSRGHGSFFMTTTPTFMTNSRSLLIGLSNEVSFVSESYVVPVNLFIAPEWNGRTPGWWHRVTPNWELSWAWFFAFFAQNCHFDFFKNNFSFPKKPINNLLPSLASDLSSP